ncbi:hypothetical protein BT96DRAFT_915633 [Gymnopus androsaceus JB14]|uniref:Uncharacterized protein n=1 Tax=Gymnopus androsaceus JB14 TaxID=1447944 RepID=A0A6A4I9Y7_9AGAR|nr:hypothetical protein BT96DRAFT_915633 [Gymnopus androsaceus JB14]
MLLDIEIYLRVPQAKAAIPAECAPNQILQPGAAARRARRRMVHAMDDPGYSWGHVATFYLKQQMPRWKRFVFRYDRVFSSLSAFKGITGNAPKLEEFEISSIEPSLINFNDWQWIPNASNISLPVLQKVSLTNTAVCLNSSLLSSQPLHTIHISSPSTLQVGSLMHTLAKHASTLRTLSLHLTSLTPPVVPASTLPFTSTSPLCLLLLQELSLSGHSLLTQLAIAIATPALEELNVDIDLGRGGVFHNTNMAANPFGGPQPLSYIEDIVIDLLNRGTPAPADRLKALSIAFGFGNGRRATRERESDPYLSALKTAQACTCAGTTFLPPGHHSPTLAPSVVHNSWQFLGNLPALESLKVGLGGAAGHAWGANGTNTGPIPYNGSVTTADMIDGFLSALCVPDDDAFTGSASIGIPTATIGGAAVGGNGNVLTLTVGFPPPPGIPAPPGNAANTNNNIHAFNVGGNHYFPPIFAPPLPPLGVAAPPPPPPPPPAGGLGNLGTYLPGLNVATGGAGGWGAGAQGFVNNTGNGWLLPTLTEIGIKVGSAAFLPSASSGGPPGLMSSTFHQYLGYPGPTPPYSNWSSSLDDPSGAPGAGHMRRLLDVVEGRNPKTGRGQSVDGVVPERLKSLELVLSVSGVPGRGVGHAAVSPSKKDKGKKKDSDSVGTSVIFVDGSAVQDIRKDKGAKATRNPNAATARTLIGTDSVAWAEERVKEVDIRCECVLWEGHMGLPRMW